VKSLAEQAELNTQQNRTGTNMRGVKTKPFITSNKVIIAWPVLHGQIGVGNMITRYLFDVIDRGVDRITKQELALQ
jgi:hypothetical protein